jgi:hypothetical protein
VEFGVQHQGLTGTIDAGRLNSAGDRFLEHNEVTQQALGAVAEYLIAQGGTTIVERNDGTKFLLGATIVPFPQGQKIFAVEDIEQL